MIYEFHLVEHIISLLLSILLYVSEVHETAAICYELHVMRIALFVIWLRSEYILLMIDFIGDLKIRSSNNFYYVSNKRRERNMFIYFDSIKYIYLWITFNLIK